jgi:hypothetical protein
MNGRFEAGNKMGRGRQRGSRNRATLFQEALERGGLAIIRKVRREALKADPTAMRLCMERLVPVAKAKNSRFQVPPLETAAKLMEAISAVMKAVTAGKLSPQEGESVARIIESQRKMMETEGYDARLRVLEEARGNGLGEEEA